jgi:NAD(P)-dependent dehydrogenase (short-subunit alcohol dehydrogenase family)
MPTSHNAANDPAGTIAADLGATVITGAAGGMGRASAERLAAPGRRLILCDLREESLAEVAGVVKERGAQVDLIAGDICDSGFSASLTERLGDSAIGALIHTAGLSPTMAEAARILEVNLFATRRLVDGLRQRMAPGGSMVLISSCSAYMIPPGAFGGELKTWLETSSQDELLAAAQTPESAYPASKRGIIALVAHEAAGFGAAGVRINSIAPGFIDTAMSRAEMKVSEQMVAMIGQVPLGRLGDADEIAKVAEFLCSPAASYVTGCDIKVDGGILGRMGL